MLSSVLDFFRAVDPYLYKLLGRDMYMALDGAPTSCYVTAGIALSAAVVIAFQAKKRLETADSATAPKSRESSQSGRRASNSDSGELENKRGKVLRCNKFGFYSTMMQ